MADRVEVDELLEGPGILITLGQLVDQPAEIGLGILQDGRGTEQVGLDVRVVIEERLVADAGGISILVPSASTLSCAVWLLAAKIFASSGSFDR